MTWRAVARKDVLDARRSRTLWVTTAVLVAVATLAVYLPTLAFPDLGGALALSFLVTPVGTVTALVALVATYAAVAGERDSGSVKVLLGLPHTRRDVVVGKFVGRSAVVCAALAVAFVAVAVVLWAVFGGVPGGFVALTVASLLYGVAFVGIGVGLSATVATRGRAAASAVGAFVGFDLLWGLLPRGVHYALNGSLPGDALPAWYVLLARANPVTAYETLARSALPESDRGLTVSSGGVEGGTAAATSLADRVVGEVPLYLDDRLGAAILACWLVIALAVGYLRLRETDL